MQEFEINKNNVLVRYHEIEVKTEVVIPDNVIAIGPRAFEHYINLTSVIIPNSVIEIGSYAFQFCKKLKNITLSEGLIKICRNSFDYCSNITKIIIPNSVELIDYHAFEYCISLADITFSNKLKFIGSRAFEGCINLKSITLPDNIVEIGTGSFDTRHIQEINLSSYKVLNLLDSKFDKTLSLIAIISTIKNYYTGKIKYSSEDMKLFKECIRQNKLKIFEKVKENKEVISIILKEMGNFLTTYDIEELLSEDYDTEIRLMLLEYSNKIRNENINPLDELTLDDDEDQNNQKNYIKK